MAENNTPYKEVADRVVAHFGTHLALAKALGYDDLRNVSAWANGLRPFPEKHCVTIERETGRLITRQQLRPTDWQEIWPELVRKIVTRSDGYVGPDTRKAMRLSSKGI